MNENKRFKQSYVCGDYGLIDNEKPKGEQWIDLYSMSENGEKNVQICLNKMNELADENNLLKAVNGEYEDALGILEEENRELKQLISKTLKEQYHLIKNEDKTVALIELKSLAGYLGVDLD